MAASGKVPVVSTFAVFATSRPYDQLRVGVAQSSLNVKVIAPTQASSPAKTAYRPTQSRT